MVSNQGYEKEIIEDGIIVYRFKSASRQCMEEWFADISQTFADAKSVDAPIRVIYDVRGVSSPTTHALKRAHDLAKLPLPTEWHVATVCDNPFAANFINFVRASSLLSSETLNRSRVFRSEEAALEWLRSV